MVKIDFAWTGLIAIATLIVPACSTTETTDQSASDPGSNAAISTPNTPPASTPVSDTFMQNLYLCPLTSVSNAPEPTDNLKILDYQPVTMVNGVQLAVAPVEKGCFSSGFGPRSGRVHKGIDLHNARAVDVFAAADGVVRRKTYRDDYGNMLVIDHGAGVFTRYAHLESFADGLAEGTPVTSGKTIGVMGSTASYRIPRHLHYEVLTGEWGAQAGSFALDPVDLFAALP
ncbi:MAG: M23 family metallopeptidase [Hyphomonadaceae bacterium]|nr:M23 family metallopeptidase [Hyphomonadaceae bacterium]